MRPTPRAVLLFGVAFVVALLPAIVDGRLWTVWAAFSALAVLALAADLLLSLSPRRLAVSAQVPDTVHVGEIEPATVTLAVAGGRSVDLDLVCDLGQPLVGVGPVRGAAPGQVTIPLEAERRGEGRVEELWLRWTGPLGLIQRHKRQRVDARVAVVPNIRQVRGAAIRFFRSPSARAGLKIERYLGDGSEFESLREFAPGMDHRAMDWRATARHRKLLTRQFRAERNHQIIAAVDTGHLMREPIAGAPRLDHAINAALMLGYCALRIGDRVGLYGFDAQVRQYLAPQGTVHAFPRILRATAQLDYATVSTNFTLGLAELSARLTRRSLVVLFTEFVDVIGAELMLENLDRLARRHLVIFVALRDPELETIAAAEPTSTARMVESVVAGDLARERDTVLRRLRRMGVLCVDAPPEGVSGQLLDRYLHVKRREMV